MVGKTHRKRAAGVREPLLPSTAPTAPGVPNQDRALQEAIDAIWQRAGDTPIPKGQSGASQSLLAVLVEAQRGQAAAEDEGERRLFFTKRLAAILVSTEGQPPAAVQAALDADPYVQSIAPNISVADLAVLGRIRSPLQEASARMLSPQDPVGNILDSVRRAHKRRPMLPADRVDMQSDLLFEHVLRQASPTWGAVEVHQAYARVAAAATDRMEVRAIALSEVSERMAKTSEGKTHAQSRMRFRQRLRASLLAAKASGDLFEALDAVVPKFGASAAADNVLTLDDVVAFVLQDRELSAIFRAHFDEMKPAERKRYLPLLAGRIRTVFGHRLQRYSVAEIAARMQREDSVFTDALVAELAQSCSETLGQTPDPAEGRNFLTAINLTNLMHRMWPGATHEDVVQFARQMGPLSPLPADFDAVDFDLLSAYSFVPPWPDGVKLDPLSEQLHLLQRSLFQELHLSLSSLPDGGSRLKETLAGALASCERFSDAAKASVEDAFRSELIKRLINASQGSWNRHRDAIGQLLQGAPAGPEIGAWLESRPSPVANTDEHGKAAVETWRELLTAAGAGRADELLFDQTWAAWWTGGAREEVAGILRELWYAERDVVAQASIHAQEAQRAKAAFSNFAKIPLAMEITQGVVQAALQESREADRALPFEDTRVVMIQHELGQAHPQVEAYRQLGMDPRKCIFVGKPYHPNPEVEETLLKVSGVDGRFLAQGDLEGMKRATEQAVDDAFAQRAPGEKVLIVCDGPYAREYAEKEYLDRDPSLAEVVRFTEQTAIGHRGEEVQSKRKRVVSYARHLQKLIEAPYIARAGVRAIQNVLHEVAETLENKTVFVKGIGGPIGRATADALLAIGAKVVGQDLEESPELRRWAEERGIRLASGPEQARGAFMVVGCAGATTIDQEQIDGDHARSDGGPCYYVSMSSELVEMDLAHVEQRATTEDGEIRRVLFSMVNDQPTYCYVLDDGSIRTVVAGGMPVNFQGINSLAPETIDATMAMSVAAAVEAMEGDALGFFGLSRFSDVIEGGYRGYLARHDLEK